MGPHWIFNPRDKVRIGGYVLVNGAYSQVDQNDTVLRKYWNIKPESGAHSGRYRELLSTRASTSYRLGVLSGLTVETSDEAIALRIGLDIVSANTVTTHDYISVADSSKTVIRGPRYADWA